MGEYGVELVEVETSCDLLFYSNKKWYKFYIGNENEGQEYYIFYVVRNGHKEPLQVVHKSGK